MTEEADTTIRVTRLGKTLAFEDREALAEHVETFVSNRVYGPLELACLQRLAELGNGDAPPDVKRISRATRLTSGETDADAERRATPFGPRIEELEAELAERAAEHEEAREALFSLRDKILAAERRGDTEEVDRLRRDLPRLEEDERVADRACRRVRAALHKAEIAADRYRADQASRFVITEDGERRVVDRAGLTDWLDANPNR